MRKPVWMKDVEARFGKPVNELIPALYAELQNMELLAKELGIHVSTLYYWIPRIGVEVERRLVNTNRSEDKVAN